MAFTKSSGFEDPVPHCSKDPPASVPRFEMADSKDGMFHQVVILSLYQYKRNLEVFSSPKVRIFYFDSYGEKQLTSFIEDYKKELEGKILWLIVPGIFNLVKLKQFTDCVSCKHKTYAFLEIPECFEGVDHSLMLMEGLLSGLKDAVGQDEISIVPPSPVVVAIVEHYKDHRQIHRKVRNGIPVSSCKFLSKLDICYDEFCQKLTKLACDRARFWLRGNPFEELIENDFSFLCIFKVKTESSFVSSRQWCELMQKFTQLVSQSSVHGERIMPNSFKEDNEEMDHSLEMKAVGSDNNQLRGVPDSFEKIVVIGKLDNAKSLQDMTRSMNLNVVYINENIDLIDNGLQVFEKILKVHTGRILWVVLCGIEMLAERGGLSTVYCKDWSCSTHVPALVYKTHETGNIDYQFMSLKRMVRTVVDKAFDIGQTLATHFIPENNGIFLSPIFPCYAIWQGDKIDPSYLCKEDPSILYLGGRRSIWRQCAQYLERLWYNRLSDFMTGIPQMLIKKHRQVSFQTLNLITNQSFTDITDCRFTWSILMVNLFQYYLNDRKTDIKSISTSSKDLDSEAFVNCKLQQIDDLKDCVVEQKSREETLMKVEPEERVQHIENCVIKQEPGENAVMRVEPEERVQHTENCVVKQEPGEEAVMRVEPEERVQYKEDCVVKQEPREEVVMKVSPLALDDLFSNFEPPDNPGSEFVTSIQDGAKLVTSPSTSSSPSNFSSSKSLPKAVQSPTEFQTTDSRKSYAVCQLDLEYLKAKVELERDCRKGLENVYQTPEIHPEYEQKYNLFKKSYHIRFQKSQGEGDLETRWRNFWTEGITQLIEKDYKLRLKALDLEHSFKLAKVTEDFLNDKLPSKTQEDASTSSMDVMDHSKTSDDLPPSNVELFVEETLSLLSEIHPFLGALSASVQSLCKTIDTCNSDKGKVCRIFQNEENRSILKRVSEKTKELAAVTTDSGSEKLVLKFQLVSVQTSKLLQWATENESQNHYGLDIYNIASLTHKKNPSYIMHTIKDLLSYNGIHDATKNEIGEICNAVLSAQVDMSIKGSGESSSKHYTGRKRFTPEEKEEITSNGKKLCPSK